MTNQIRNELNSTLNLYRNGNYEEALEIFEKYYKEHFDMFSLSNRITYSWVIYQIHIKNFEDESELFEYGEFVTELIPQQDLRKRKSCPYVMTVFRLLDHLKGQNDFFNMPYWLDKINPDLLPQKRSRYNGRIMRSLREKYFDYASKAYLECMDYEECIEISKEALITLRSFTNNSDTWHNLRIAKSYKELEMYDEALEYYNKVIEVKPDWFTYKDMAEIYYNLNRPYEALDYLCPAILSNDPIERKVNLYYLAYKVFGKFNEKEAIRHAQMYFLLKRQSGAQMAEEIEDMDFDESLLNLNNLEDEIRQGWTLYRFKDQELKYGTITKVFEHGKSGFITSNDHESFYFNALEFKEDMSQMEEGLYVSFYTQKAFDKSKNRESLNAVHIKTA